MKILLIGSQGRLGYEILKICKTNKSAHALFNPPDFDITCKKSVFNKINKINPDIVINASGFTDVDLAEREPNKSYRVNRDGPGYLATACYETKSKLIHFSTDYVFNGKTNEPYSENDLISPLSVYGKSKAAGETKVRDRLSEHIIIRTSWLYSSHKNCFVHKIIKLANEQKTLQVVNDQYGCPTFSKDLADTVLIILNLIESKEIKWGTYHYCGKDPITWFQFALRIIELAKRYKTLKVNEILPISTKEYHSIVERPSYSVLNCSLIEKEFNIKRRPFQESLKEMVDQYFLNGKFNCH